MNKWAKRGVVVAASIAATTTIGAGIASWQVTGVSVSGSDTPGQSASKQGLTLVTTAPAGIFPTQVNAGSITATVTNPNPFNVTMTSATVTGVSGCTGIDLAHFTFGAATLTTPVAAKAGGTPAQISIPISAVGNGLPDTCASSPISFRVSANGESSS